MGMRFVSYKGRASGNDYSYHDLYPIHRHRGEGEREHILSGAVNQIE